MAVKAWDSFYLFGLLWYFQTMRVVGIPDFINEPNV